MIRLSYTQIDLYCDSYEAPSASIILDVGDTFDAAHASSSLCSGIGSMESAEARAHVRRMIRCVRRRWPDTRILLRGDGHYARSELMGWCKAADIEFLFGMPMNAALRRDPIIAAGS